MPVMLRSLGTGIILALGKTSFAQGECYASHNASCILAIDPLQAPFPYAFPLLGNAETPGLFPMRKCRGITLEEATIDQLQGYMSDGTLTSSDLLDCYIKRVRQVDEYINSVIELNPDAEDIAAALDEERRAGKVRGPLHGIPFLVKDNIATKDNMETTAGSWMLLGSVVPRDAFVVAKLRQAGALLMGKATLSEWADMRSNNYSEGYSPRGGQARSPYNLTLNPGGSSSGSAAAVAANVVSFSLGTETDGSVINPAERNALVGIKPTVGLTSRAGVIPESIHQDTVGTFGRTVRDAAYAFDAIHGIDHRDNYTLAQDGKTPSGGYMQFLANRSALRNATFGLPWDSFWVYADQEQQATLLSLISLIEDAGATVINNTELPNYQTIVSPDGWNWDYGTTRGYPNESEYTVVKVDFYNNIKSYLSELDNTDIRSLEDIVAYNYANDGTEGGNAWPLGIPAFYSGQDGFLASLETKGDMDETYYQALSFTQRSTREEGIDAALANKGNPLDALLVPPDVGQTYQIAAQAGYPMITLPAGVHADTGMPFGLALMGTAWSEASLLKWASAIEDLQLSSNTSVKRTLPNWYSYLERNIPVRNL
ncbi:glutamyl-tRNA amidotransferase subunit A [Corynespora cassiicola Philippines]|uniref:Glutamyl-tRNA amidotransferase subunit A n=1 Tax=Corynespora cassiicola Philippines TaxID=1448308 RepID=A0A2T2P9D0_CORCC|nr:glutamyl-tRNA amidotransferase subunit A [Corynespora cassiicola Philippines]